MSQALARDLARDESPVRLGAATLTDLSANIFAALFLILLILLATAGPQGPVEARRDLGSRARAPLSAGALVELLRERLPRAPGLSLDLSASRIGTSVETAPGSGEAPFAILDRLLARGEGRSMGPVRLYVFSPRLYAPVAERLERAGQPWREITVPAALRDPSGEGWSPAFLALPDDPARFREGLARLLSAAPMVPLQPNLSVGGEALSGGFAAGDRGAAPLGARIGRWFGAFLEVAAIIAGCATVFAIEKLVPKP